MDAWLIIDQVQDWCFPILTFLVGFYVSHLCERRWRRFQMKEVIICVEQEVPAERRTPDYTRLYRGTLITLSYTYLAYWWDARRGRVGKYPAIPPSSINRPPSEES